MAIDQVPLAYDYDGEGRLLVAIHGITENRHFWDRVPLSRHFRVLRVDLRGQGDTPPAGPYTFETATDDVHKLVSRLAPGETPLVLGHSLGAWWRPPTARATQSAAS
jgi:pimeloyl-ACP methyl ester carboxylesterase